MTEKLGAVNPNRYIRSAFWLTASKTASMGVSLFATFYIARTLGPQNFGELSYAQSVLAIFTVLSAAVGALYRDLVKRPDEEGRMLGTAWFIYLSVSFVSVMCVMAYMFSTPHDRLTILVVAILCAAQFFSPFAIIQNVFYAKTETKWLSLANFALHIFISLLKIAAMIWGQGVLVLAAIMVIEQALMATIYIGLYTWIHHGFISKWRFDRQYAKELIFDSLPIVFLASSGIISARVDQIFIRHYLDMTAVGLYGVAVQLSELWQFIPGLVIAAVFPAIINARQHGHMYRHRLFFLAAGIVIYGACISVVLTVLAEPIITTIYGSAFRDSAILLQIYSWSMIGMILGFLINHFLLAENLRRVQLVTALLPAIVNISLNFLFIPRMGAIGAAYATLISYSFMPIIPFLFKSARAALSARTL